MADIYSDFGDQLNSYIYAVHDFLNMDRFEDAELVFDSLEDDVVGGSIVGDMEVATISVDLEMEWDMLLTTIAHEMVHACQLFSGRLKQHIKCTLFDGVRVDTLPYNERPQEVEAYLIEEYVKVKALEMVK